MRVESQFVYDPERDMGFLFYGQGIGSGGYQATLHFQHGPIKTSGVNGIQNEEVLGLLIERLRHLNARMPCRENSLAITHLQEGLMWLEERTKDRERRGVEGLDLP